MESEAAAVYDRQIRIWGAEAQHRMLDSSVLITGELLGLASEVAKNVVLAGMNVVLADSTRPTPAEIPVNFFLREGDDTTTRSRSELMVPRLQEMNPLARVAHSHSNLPGGPELFSLVVVCDARPRTASLLETAWRNHGTPVVVCGTYGLNGYIFMDGGATPLVYSKETKIDGVVATSRASTMAYPALETCFSAKTWPGTSSKKDKLPSLFYALSFLASSSDSSCSQSDLEALAAARGVARLESDLFSSAEIYSMAQQVLSESWRAPAVNAILGGLVGQEVIKVITQKDAPVENWVFLDGETGAAVIRRVQPAA